MGIVNRSDMEPTVFGSPGHVRAHPANANKTQVHV
jgi:hypothetical protein